jgi:hypothetical protein
VPSGLEFHLRGHGNVQRCPVLKAAWDLARDALKPKFSEEDARTEEELERRRGVEHVFLVDPFAAPRLLNEGLFFNHPSFRPRDNEGLAWAEARLQNLGFEVSLSGNVKTCKLERVDHVIYADPREAKRINFLVCKKPLPTRRRRRGGCSSFAIQDRWRKDLNNKFEMCVREAIGKLR